MRCMVEMDWCVAGQRWTGALHGRDGLMRCMVEMDLGELHGKDGLVRSLKVCMKALCNYYCQQNATSLVASKNIIKDKLCVNIYTDT